MPPKRRLALSHVGGRIHSKGDSEIASKLAHAVQLTERDAIATREHVHGFHSYPARLHPRTAARLIAELSPPTSVILDPFCGSGTVLVEALLQGRIALGTDINPLAIRLAKLKTWHAPKQEIQTLIKAARAVSQHVQQRRIEHARVTHRYDPEIAEAFEPHILMELDDVYDGICHVEPESLRIDLELILSAILTKVSRKQGDTSVTFAPKRLPPGFVTRLFLLKAQELVQALDTFNEKMPTTKPAVKVYLNDARELRSIRTSSIDLIVSSPPYAGTYDYLSHHDLRLRWFDLSTETFASSEIGSRRTYARLNADRILKQWKDEFGKSLQAMTRVLKENALAILIVADTAVHRTALRVDQLIEQHAKLIGLEVIAQVSQDRPHFHQGTADAFRNKPKQEHVIALRKVK